MFKNAKRRWATLLVALCLALAGLVTATGSASAAPPNCNHSSGPGVVVDPFYVNIQGDGAHVGAVQLCTKDGYYWGYIQLYAPVGAGNWGQVTLYHYHNGVVTGSWTCDSAGGNAYVAPGQTQCWTPRIHRASAADLFQAFGEVCHGTHPNCILDAWGTTHVKA